MCLITLAALAQNRADIEVSYDYKHFHRTGKLQNHQMILLANSTESKFYSPETEYVDSLEYTPEGKEIYNQMKMAAFTSGNLKSVPSRRVPMYIFKSKTKGTTEVYDGQSLMMFTFFRTLRGSELGDRRFCKNNTWLRVRYGYLRLQRPKMDCMVCC